MRKTENKKLVRLTDQYIQNVNDLLKRKQRRKRKCERSAIKKVTMNEENKCELHDRKQRRKRKCKLLNRKERRKRKCERVYYEMLLNSQYG